MKLCFKSKDLNCYFQSKSSAQYFDGYFKFTHVVHSTRLIEWYIHELFISLRSEIMGQCPFQFINDSLGVFLSRKFKPLILCNPAEKVIKS